MDREAVHRHRGAVDMNAATAFESMVGKGMSLLPFGSPFMNC